MLNKCVSRVRRHWMQPCVLCGNPTLGERLCQPCASNLPWLDSRVCRTCATPIATGEICGACLKDAPHLDAVRAALVYAFPVDALIRAYKYGADLSLVRTLGEIVAAVATDAADLVLPMPLADERLRERGFNQAYELAREVRRLREIPLVLEGCRKVRHTTPQAALPWSERRRNIRGVFVCDADVAGKRVAVIDDVMTTGATLNELAKNIKRAGAASVVGWVVARALRQDVGMGHPNATAANAGRQTPVIRD